MLFLLAQHTLMHNCPKRCQLHSIFGKTVLWTPFCAFKENSIVVHTETQQWSFLFNPQNSSKNMHTSAPSLMQATSMGKCFKHKPLLWGAHILRWPQEKHDKLCASLSTFYSICMDVQTDALKPHQPYPCTIGSMQSAIANAIPTLWPSFLPTWHAFLWITSVHSSQITSQAAFTSAPLWRRISTTSLHPFCADANKGVAPSWGIQHGEQMQAHKREWSPNKCWTISVCCLFILHLRKCKHSIDCVKA